MERTTRRVVLPVVGLATAAVTTTAGVLPALAAPSGANEPSATTSTTTPSDGTYESCSAYFGYGKENGALELVEFDTAVTGGKPTGATPTVENGGIDVILEIHGSGGEDGSTLKCIPEEVTEAEWDDVWGDSIVPGPAYPGPGHYVYPTATPEIRAVRSVSGASAARPADLPDIGDVTSVDFRVTSIPQGYTLVSPTGSKTLQQNAFAPFVQIIQGQVPSALSAVVAAGPGGEAAVAALDSAIETCSDDETLPDPTPEALFQALDSLVAYISPSLPYDPPEVLDCDDVFEVLALSAYIAGARATTTYSETITVSLPVAPTTAPTTTPTAAQPTVVTPRFTG